MSYCDFALLGKTFVCLLIVISGILTAGCFQKVSFLSSVLSFISLKSDLLKQKKKKIPSIKSFAMGRTTGFSAELFKAEKLQFRHVLQSFGN